MRVSHRAYGALVPGVLGAITVIGLVHWELEAHAAPQWLLVVAILAALGSFASAWSNARAPGERGATPRMNQPMPSATEGDTLARGDERRAPPAEQQEYAELLALASRDALQRLDEIRLPLHILLENHFGDLNENQEEMLAAARAAAEHAGDAFQRLAEIADLDRGATVMRRDRIRPADLVAAVLPSLAAEGQQRQVRVAADVAPALQSIPGDRGRLLFAFELILHDALRRTPSSGELRITADAAGRDVVVGVVHGGGTANPIASALGRRLIRAHGGEVRERDEANGNHVTDIRLTRA